MAALKKENKTDKTTKSAPETSQNVNSKAISSSDMPVIAPIAKSAQTKGEVTTKTPAKKVLIIESKEHYENILKEAGDKYVMVEFFAQWCCPCKAIEVKLDELAELYKNKVVIVKIDVDNLEELAIEHDVTTMPAFTIMKNNVKVEQFFGSKVELLEAAFEKYMGKAKE